MNKFCIKCSISIVLVHGYLGYVAYLNNSVVNLSDIGLDNNALFCYTNLTTCCKGSDNPSGGADGV